MERNKNTELNFLYMNDKYQNKKKVKKKNKTRAGKEKSAQSEKFDFDNEIVIGVTKVNDGKNKKTNNKKKQTKIKKKQNISKSNNNKIKKVEKNRKQNGKLKDTNKIDKKNKLAKGIIKWTILLSALVAAIIFFMMSPLFNLAEIQVMNNEKLSTDTIISLSGLKLGENIYKTSSSKIEEKIKENAYIETVKIQRKLPNKIVMTVKERKATYMLEYANSFAYINNQGYILEISQEKLQVPILIGYETSQEEIQVRNRLIGNDLEKLGTILKIVESANGNGIGNAITKINMQDKQNYTLILEEEKKTVYLGDATNLSNRMLYLKAILEEEKGIEGEIFINGDLNKTNVFFRQKE